MTVFEFGKLLELPGSCRFRWAENLHKSPHGFK
jgi:hypothetical protein